MKLRLLKPHDYNNKRYNAGEEIETTDEMGNYLVKIKVAVDSTTITNIPKENPFREVLNYDDKEKNEQQPSPEKVEFNPTVNEKKRGRPKKEKK